MVDLNRFIEWSKDNPRCLVKIEVGGYEEEDIGRIRVWVYDYKISAGQFVSSVDEIDLEAEYKRDMEQKRQEVEKYFQKKEVVV